MVKCNYFENLEDLSRLCLSAVSIACGDGGREKISTVRTQCDRLVLETEDALFSDFLPPLERDNIAAAAHTLSRVIDQANELISDPYATPAFMRANTEGQICIRLSEELVKDVSLLRHIRRPDELPDLQGFRQLLSEGRNAHKQMILKLRNGGAARNAGQVIILTGKLRMELSEAFDEIVEIMLNNI